MAYFPLFIEMEGRNVLVVGAGTIATRRIVSLLEFGASLTVVAQIPSEKVLCLAKEDRLQLYNRAFQIDDVTGMDLVFSATNNPDTETLVYEICKTMCIPVNIASNRKLCDVYFPGLVRQDEIVIGLTSGGTDHSLVKRTTEKLKEFLKEVDNETDYSKNRKQRE